MEPIVWRASKHILLSVQVRLLQAKFAVMAGTAMTRRCRGEGVSPVSELAVRGTSGARFPSGCETAAHSFTDLFTLRRTSL